MIALLCERLRRTTQLFEDSAFLNVATRLAKLLLVLAAQRSDKSTITVSVSQSELAQMIGVSREAVSKQLSHWRDSGVIRLGRGKVVIIRSAYFEMIVGAA
jgi:CRP/FNR family transcriptional regulator, cyclic AMP receptor protein